MAFSSGTRLGPYEIQSPIGAGGMGEVYRARDTRLGRDVAIKVLPAHLASNPELKQRLDREAKVISSLNHPHICVLYDVGHQDGTDYATVNVTVVESPGVGIPNATVTIIYTNGTTATGTTDGNGLATFTNQPVSVAATVNMVLNDGSGRTASQTIAGGFAPGVNPLAISILPVPTGTVTGLVRDQINSVPLGNVQVVFLDANSVVVAIAITLADGTYSISSVAAGTYTLAFSLTNYVSFYAPSVVIVAGTTTTQNAQLAPVAPPSDATVDVTVYDEIQTVVANVTVTITYSNGTSSGPIQTDGSGNAIIFNQPVNQPATITATQYDSSGTVIRQGQMTVGQGFISGVNQVRVDISPAQ